MLSEVAIAAREKELGNARKQLALYQKEVAGLKLTIESRCGEDKYGLRDICLRVAEMENKLEASQQTGVNLQKEIKGLRQLGKHQGKELERIIGTKEYENKIRMHNDSIKVLKDRAKELERRIASNAANDAKLQDYTHALTTKYSKLKSETDSLRKTSSTTPKKPALVLAVAPQAADIEQLKVTLLSLKKTLEQERSAAARRAEELRGEIVALGKKAKETEQENRLNALRVRELSRVLNPVHPIVSQSPGAVVDTYTGRRKKKRRSREGSVMRRREIETHGKLNSTSVRS